MIEFSEYKNALNFKKMNVKKKFLSSETVRSTIKTDDGELTASHKPNHWLQDYYAQLPESHAAQALSEQAIVQLVKALR